MTFATHYNVGSVTVTAGSATVVGSGTFWTGNVAAGDILWVNGLSCRIQSVNSNTNLTLARNWPGATAAGAYYEAWAVLDAVGYQKKVGDLLSTLSSGNLEALAALNGAADRLPYFSGAGTLALATLTAHGRSLLSDANVAAFWSTIGATSPADKAYRQGNIIGTVAYSGGDPSGAIIERGANANGDYVRFADGTQIVSGTPTVSSTDIAAAGTYTLPLNFAAAFAAGPNMSASLGFAAANTPSVLRVTRWSIGRFPSATAGELFITATDALSTSVTCQFIAFGRWR